MSQIPPPPPSSEESKLKWQEKFSSMNLLQLLDEDKLLNKIHQEDTEWFSAFLPRLKKKNLTHFQNNNQRDDTEPFKVDSLGKFL
jgi:hypothetical protein